MQTPRLLCILASVALCVVAAPMARIERIKIALHDDASISSNPCASFGFDNSRVCLFCSQEELLPFLAASDLASVSKAQVDASATCLTDLCEACGSDAACLTVNGRALAPLCARLQSQSAPVSFFARVAQFVSETIDMVISFIQSPSTQPELSDESGSGSMSGSGFDFSGSNSGSGMEPSGSGSNSGSGVFSGSASGSGFPAGSGFMSGSMSGSGSTSGLGSGLQALGDTRDGATDLPADLPVVLEVEIAPAMDLLAAANTHKSSHESSRATSSTATSGSTTQTVAPTTSSEQSASSRGGHFAGFLVLGGAVVFVTLALVVAVVVLRRRRVAQVEAAAKVPLLSDF
eukprot:m.127748 g.127748  ORF g.127748 m.127748 type:complete len:346 (+) comp52272_c0_seq1:1915-2952(+)